jgi:HEAT repeat protein/ATP/ADP translocase
MIHHLSMDAFRSPKRPSLARAAGIRAGEGRILTLVALLFMALETGRGVGEVGVDTLVVSRFGVGTLPYLFIGLGATSLVAAIAYGAALGKVSRTPLLVGVLGGAAAFLVAGRLVMASGTEAVVPLIWLVTYAAGTLAGTISWTIAGSVFDARQAKRLFPLCTGAAIAGNFLGSLTAGPIAAAAGTELLIVIEAGLLAVVAAIVVAIARTGSGRTPARYGRRAVVQELRVGLDEVVLSPLFRLVALAYVLFSVLSFSVSYPFLQAASTTFPSEGEFATAIGFVSAAVTATSFLVSLTLANRIYARFGVAGAALILPIVYVVGFGLWLVQFTFVTAAIVRFSQQVSQRGITNAAWSAFYNVIPIDRRAQVLAFVDGVPGQIGIMLSGLLLLGAGTVFAAEQIFWLGAGTAIAVTVVVLAIRSRYASSLLRTLRAGLGEQVLEGGPGLAALSRDPQVGAALASALGAPEPAVRRMAVALAARINAGDASAVLLNAVDDPDPGVRAAAVTGLASLQGDESLVSPVVGRLDDPEPVVRSAAVRSLGLMNHVDLPATLEPLGQDPDVMVRAAIAVALDERPGTPVTVSELLADPSPDVRHAAIEAVAAVGGLSHGATIARELVDALDDPDTRVRRTAADLLARRDAETDGVVDLLETGSVRAQEAALLALMGHGAAVREPVIAWAESQIARAAAHRRARVALEGTDAPPAPDSALGFLAHVLERREMVLANGGIGALAVLGAEEARGVLRRCVWSGDAETRAQALEALDSVGDRRLRRAIVTFLDADAGASPEARDIVLHRLVGDADPWVARLARRAIDDAAGSGGMADTDRTISDIDTMLLLRRVPLFAELDPEDLQRVANTCSERIHPRGTVVMREGDIGSELLVIVEGSVRVVRMEADGSERLIRRYESGDHIGELAVLREGPRAATVIAEDDIRTLVIDGRNLKAILRERPEAAMAMLATLAERISVQ